MDRNQLITICTATFNRGKLLRRLFTSLKAQTNTTFEWIIIDDGSTDNTTNIVSEMQQQASFDIMYHKKINEGKHIAINKAVALANGSSFFIVDSDDRLPVNALAVIKAKFMKIYDNPDVAGVVGLKCFFDKKVVGSNHFNDEVICDIFKYRYEYKVTGDRAEVFKTEILRKYPFPKFSEEKFLPESIVWNRIGQQYDMLFFNENVYECEYLADGLSAQSVYLRRKYPKGAINLYAELAMTVKLGMTIRNKAHINFWRFYLCNLSDAQENLKLLKNSIKAFIYFPFGLILYLKDSLTQRNKR